MFTLEEGPGILFKALAVFSLRDINLTKVRWTSNMPCYNSMLDYIVDCKV